MTEKEKGPKIGWFLIIFLLEGEQLEIAWKRLAASISKCFPSNEVPNVKQVPNKVPNSKQVRNEVPNEVPSEVLNEVPNKLSSLKQSSNQSFFLVLV